MLIYLFVCLFCIENQLSPVSSSTAAGSGSSCTRLTPTDDGYHSTGGPDELTPPEDSSDSDSDNNFVLDFSVKKDKRSVNNGSTSTNLQNKSPAHSPVSFTSNEKETRKSEVSSLFIYLI